MESALALQVSQAAAIAIRLAMPIDPFLSTFIAASRKKSYSSTAAAATLPSSDGLVAIVKIKFALTNF